MEADIPNSRVAGSSRRTAFVVAVAYAAVAAAWIAVSDLLLAQIAPDVAAYRRLQTYKGWLFVLVTTVALYAMLEWWFGRLARSVGRFDESQRRLSALIDASPLAIAMTDTQGTVEVWNPAAERMFGWTAAEVEGTRLPIVPESGRGEFDRLFARVLAGEPVPSAEVRRRRKDGSLVEVSLSAAVLRGAEGMPRGIVALFEDISDRKRIEEDRARLAQAIAQAGEAVIITDPTGRIEYVNPAFERITGFARDEVLGRNPRILKSGVQGPAFYRMMWDTLTRGEIWQSRFTNRRKDGSLYQQESVISPVRDAEGHVAHFVAVARDVTREITLESQLRQAQKLESVGQLTGGIAHDFNNLLSVMIANVELIIGDLGDDASPDMRESLAELGAAARSGASMVRKLLGFSRRAELRFEPVDLAAVVGDAVSMLRRTIPEHVKIQTAVDADAGSVLADVGALHQILINLANNARDAMPSGGSLRIEAAPSEITEAFVRERGWGTVGRYARLTVRDSGSGMDAETLGKAFDPFFTTKPAGVGTGLGLAMVYGLVKQHGGFVDLASTPGQGTTVSIYLPGAAAPTRAEPAPAPRESAPRGRETILLVEDGEHLRDTTRRVLERLGYEVIVAVDGRDALARFDEAPERIALVLTDVVMPNLGGRELYRALRDRGATLPVLLMSGYTDRDVRTADGVDLRVPLLQKPWSVADLAGHIRTMLDGRA